MKPVLIGMNNPLNSDPKFALFPYPPGCTGHRIFCMLQSRRPGVLRKQYLETFDRRNLINDTEWVSSLPYLRDKAEQMRKNLVGRTVVLLGNEVRRAFGLRPVLVHPQEMDGVTWRQLPHPSGRNLWYNDRENYEVAALLIEELFVQYQESQERARVTA
jgi:hypothetical protein